MKYRKFGGLDWDVSILGFGTGYLPLAYGDPDKVDETETIRMIRYAIDNGINYLDLGRPDAGEYEQILRTVGRAMRDGYRDKTKIAVNLRASFTGEPLDINRYLDKVLNLLETDNIDFFILAGLNRYTWPELQEQNIIKSVEKALSGRLIGYLGFGFHDQYQFLKDIIAGYDNWSLCQFQYSYMDIDHHPGVTGLKYAAEKGLAVVVTEPLKRGQLTIKPPEPVAEVWENAPKQRTPAEWGLRWVWNHPEIATVICDMSTIKQLIENITVAGIAEAESFSMSELVLVAQVRDAYRKLKSVPCTACRNCMPCPVGIDVPRIFEIYNDTMMYGDNKTARSTYEFEKHNINNCTECGACEKACGREIPIIDWLKKANLLFSE